MSVPLPLWTVPVLPDAVYQHSFLVIYAALWTLHPASWAVQLQEAAVQLQEAALKIASGRVPDVYQGLKDTERVTGATAADVATAVLVALNR